MKIKSNRGFRGGKLMLKGNVLTLTTDICLLTNRVPAFGWISTGKEHGSCREVVMVTEFDEGTFVSWREEK